MDRPFDLYKKIEDETDELAAGGVPEGVPFSVKTSFSETKQAKVLIKKARNKSLLQSMENPFKDDQDIMNYLDRAIDRARSPLDELELKMLHDSLCRDILKERTRKKT